MNQALADFEHGIESLPPDVVASEHNLATPETVDTPRGDLEKAGALFDMLKDDKGEGGPDAAVGDLVQSAGEFYTQHQSDEALEEAAIADEVGAFQILNGGDSDDTAKALAESPHEPLEGALKEMHEADPSGEAIKVITEAIDHAEHQETSIEKEASPTDSLVARLQLQRQRVGVYNSELKRYEESRQKGIHVEPPESVWYDEADIKKVHEMLKDDAVSAPDSVRLIDELYNVTSHTAQLETINSRLLSSGEKQAKADERTNEIMTNYMNTVPFLKFKEMRALRSDQRGRLTHILQKLDTPVGMRRFNREMDVKFRARIGGFGSVKEYYQACKTRETSANDLTYFDTLADLGPESTDSEKSDFGFEFLANEMGLSSTLSSEMMVAMYGRASEKAGPTDDERVRSLSLDRVRYELEKVAKAVDQVGAEKIERLRTECGMVNVGEMSPDQLDRMVRLMDRDPLLIQELQSKEVCAILKDATSDWNGAFRGMSKEYETNQGSTLVFEVSNLKSSDRQLQDQIGLLRSLGIRPAVLVIAGHGKPGALRLGDGVLIPHTDELIQDEQLEGATTLAETGLDQLIADMKPDRDGNCTVIYKSCSQGGALSNEDDSTLTRTAKVVRDTAPGKTYQIYGTKRPNNIRPDEYGDIHDSVNGQRITRVIVGESGAIYSHESDQSPRLPMFQTEVPDYRVEKPTVVQEAEYAA